MALMEAMACGVPVVATEIAGIPELVEAEVTGVLVPSGNPVAIADAVERLARDADLRRRLGKKGRNKVMREFDLHANALELLRLMARHTPREPLAAGSERCLAATGSAR